MSGVGRSGEGPAVTSVPWWKEQTARLQLAGCGMLVICAPFLAFPEIIPSPVRAPLVVVVATLGFAVRATLLGQSGRLRYILWPLATLALLAWFRSPSPHQADLVELVATTNARGFVDLAGEATQHLAGLALGLLAMSAVACVA